MFDIKFLPVEKFIVIGSYALGTRVSSDIDIVCSIEDINVPVSEIIDLGHTISFTYDHKKIECMLIEKQPSLKILYDSYLNSGKRVDYANVAELFAIKKAHIHRANIQWVKHIHDYHNLKKQLANTLSTDYVCCNGTMTIDQFSLMHKETLDNLLGTQKQVPLMGVTKEDFFDDYVKKIVDHDWLHEIYAHTSVPIYTKLQKDPTIVYCDPIEWEKLEHIEKCFCVLEECYVIATERFLIKQYVNDPSSISSAMCDKAFTDALTKVCTTLTSGFFRSFAIEHYFDLKNNYNKQYFEVFKLGYREHVEGI